MSHFTASTAAERQGLGKRLISRLWGRPPGADTELALWRERILAAILASGVALSPVALVPAVFLLVDKGHYIQALIDCAAVVVAFGLLVARRIPYAIRAGISLAIAFGVGLGIVLSVGPMSGGPAWLFCTAVLAGVLFGVKGALTAVAVNAITLATLGLLWLTGQIGYSPAFQSPLQAGVAGFNFLFLNAVTSLSVAVLVRGLENAARREKAVSESLGRETAERLRMAQDLADSEARLRIIFDHAAVGIAETALDGRLMRVNRRFGELLGYAPAELGAMTVADISHPDEYPAEIQQVRAVVTNASGAHTMEKRLRRKDGHWIWGRVTVTLVRDGQGQPSHFIGVLEDVTERRIALEALKESEIRYRSILESAPDSITITRVTDGTYMEVNPHFCRLSGYSRQEALGRTPFDLDLFANPDDRQRLVAELAANGEVNGMELRYRRKDGSFLDALLSARRLRYAGQDCIVAVATDISEPKRVAQALAASEERFRQLAELMPETIFECDPQSYLTFVNRQAYVTFGYCPEDMAAGLKTFDVIAPEDRSRALENMTAITAGHKQGLNEYTAVRKDGTRFPVMIRSTPIVQDGTLIGLRGFIIDLTEKKKMETQIRQSQKMEAIGTLAGGIAHDFNNILSAVLGYTDLSLIDARPGSLIHGNLLKIRKAGERARDLVRQILTFSRKTEKEMVPVQIRPIVSEAIKLLRATLPATIEIDTDLDSSATVLADPTQIHQVVMNLCTNAGHAMAASGGVLRVRLEDVDVPVENDLDLGPGAYLRLSVADTGHGMTAAIMERIFDPFFTTKGPDKGTGMGLAVVHGIVKSHGGAIAVTSAPDQGAVFTVHLPSLPVAAPAAAPAIRSFPTGTESILLIDDESFQVELGVQMLQKLGYTVEATTQVDEALNLFRAGPGRFDLVITDMTMPQMTGVALARELLAIRPDIPIVLCTGYSEQISETEALALGIKAFALKPIKFPDLAELVRRVIDEHKTDVGKGRLWDTGSKG